MRHLHLAERSIALEDEVRQRRQEAPGSLSRCVDYLKEYGYWKAMSVHFPNIAPYEVLPRGTIAYWLEGDAPLTWMLLGNENGKVLQPGTEVAATVNAYSKSSSSVPHALPTQSNTLYHEEIFKPSNQHVNQPQNVSEDMRRKVAEAGVDINNIAYKGNISQSFLENRLCAEAYNCAIHVSNIDPKASDKEVLGMIWEGGIQKSHRLQPVDGLHTTCGANFAFKTPEAARDFLMRSRTEGMWIRGLRLFATANIDKCKPMQQTMLYQTRVLHIIGPDESLDADKLEDLLHAHITFRLVGRQEWKERN
ncbi:hypothetical protein EG329_010161 [Mollisiaceae sp. DMI_Dod_QoI]|nr:hypothetical protein EG329_010161 [Helotiales sp. DMI_Dod_QoI]